MKIMADYPLATIISQTQSGPYISHLPLVVEQKGDELYLLGHLARANSHWKVMNGQSPLVIFHGPNAYITPQWYEQNDAPTWNYVVVHVTGNCTLIENSSDLQMCLEKLTDHVEVGSNPWKFWIPEDLSGEGKLEKAIVGFSIKIESIQSKFKLSQNRSQQDRQRVIQGLIERGDEMSLKISKLMNENLRV